MGKTKTGGEIFDGLRGFYPSIDAMNEAIDLEWRNNGHRGFRMGAAEALLERRRRLPLLDGYDATTRSYEQTGLL